VVQKFIKIVSPEKIQFVVEELQERSVDIARHRFGCRLLCRLLEHGSLHEPSIGALFEEVLWDTQALSRHTYGNYVIRHCLEFGLSGHRHWIAQALCADLLVTARHRFGSRVVQTALQFCQPDDQDAIATGLLQDTEQLMMLAKALSGRHVVKALLRMPRGQRQRAASILRPGAAQLQASKYGKPVLDALAAIAM
jgi:hypothetical protein